MFNAMKTPQEFAKAMTEFYASVPKTPEDAKIIFEKVQAVFKDEYANSQDMWKIYHKAATGDASINEITEANKKASELLKTTAFAGVIAFPGALFILPGLVKAAKELNVDIVPASVSKRFAF